MQFVIIFETKVHKNGRRFAPNSTGDKLTAVPYAETITVGHFADRDNVETSPLLGKVCQHTFFV